MPELHRLANASVSSGAEARPIRVSVMGRDAILRSGLASHLRANHALAVVEGRSPLSGVVVMATDLIDHDAIAALRAVRLQGSSGIVLLASRLDADQAHQAAEAGACRWLGRWAASPSALAEAVIAAAACTHRADEHMRTWLAATTDGAPQPAEGPASGGTGAATGAGAGPRAGSGAGAAAGPRRGGSVAPARPTPPVGRPR